MVRNGSIYENQAPDHLTDVCSVSWPLNQSEARADFVFLNPLGHFFVYNAVLTLSSRKLHKKSS